MSAKPSTIPATPRSLVMKNSPVGWLEANPGQTREMANLEVPRLNIQHFDMIVTAEDPSPTQLTIPVKLFLSNHFPSVAGTRFF